MAALLRASASTPWAATLRRLDGEGQSSLRAVHRAACDTLLYFSDAEAARINRAAADERRYGPGGPKLAWYTPLGEYLRNEERVAILDEREQARAAARAEITDRFPEMAGFYAAADLVGEAAHDGDLDKYGLSYAPSACRARLDGLGAAGSAPQPQPQPRPSPPAAGGVLPAPVAPSPQPSRDDSELAEIWGIAEREYSILKGEERPAKKPRQ